ncbi:MAG: FxLYD domain-containing protein [Thermoanaerobaculia bacterium]
MRHRNGIVHGIALGLLALGVAALPARADWLVTRDGGRVETKGTWQTKGKLVVFTRAADGALASLRATEVDLDASAKATADAKVKAEAPPQVEPEHKKIAVLTDKDFRKPTPPGGGADTPEKGAPAKSGPLAVSNWKKLDTPSGDGIAVEGQVHNTTKDMMINASVDVELFNEAGERVGTAQGLLTSTSIEPDGTVSFRANFPGVFTFTDARFKVNGLPLTFSSPPGDGDKPADQAPPQ